MATPTTPLFVKTHDFNVWLFKHTQRFPKHFRYSYTNRLENTALEFEELILMANAAAPAERKQLLAMADGKLLACRALVRYTLDFELLGSRQFEFAAQCIDELGRLLGAWLKGLGR